MALFYADNGLIVSRNPEWLQMALDRLVSFFERIGLKTNTRKTKTMACVPGYISARQSDAVYERRMDGVG